MVFIMITFTVLATESAAGQLFENVTDRHNLGFTLSKKGQMTGASGQGS